jgi:membrane protein DedA with SNARE-associated domain
VRYLAIVPAVLLGNLGLGPVGVFAARFIPGLRVMAGPLAGAGGLRVLPFLAANALGVAASVPVAVTAGYAVGYGVTATAEPFWSAMGQIGLLGAVVWAAIWAGSRRGRGRSIHRMRAPSAEGAE